MLARYPVQAEAMTPFAAYRAARALETIPQRQAALSARQDRATATLGAVLGSADRVAIPGYLVLRTPEGIVARPVAGSLPAGWRQLAIEED